MPARDKYHDQIVRALKKDGWTITDDPLTIAVLGTELMIDLGAERVLAAERAGRRIAVEIKSFIKASGVQDLKEATGQFMLYTEALKRNPKNSDRILYLAIRESSYTTVFRDSIGQILLESQILRLIVIDEMQEEVKQWIP